MYSKGKDNHLRYFEAMKFLLEDIQDCQKQFTELQKKVGDKHQRAQAAGQWATLSKGRQNLISEVISMFSQMASLLGKITKSITHDVKQLTVALNKIGANTDDFRDPAQSRDVNEEGITTNLQDGTMAASAFIKNPTRSLPEDFSYQSWAKVPESDKPMIRALNDRWVKMTQELMNQMQQRETPIETVTIYLFVTSDGNIKLGVFGFPGQFNLSRNGSNPNAPIAFNVQNVPKDELPETLQKELKPTDKIYINC